MNVVIRRAAAAVRRHWLITTVLVVGVMLRVAVQTAYLPALLYIDSVRYLYAESNRDPLGYLAVLWPLLRIGGLGLVSASQHALGIGMAVAIYAVALRRGAHRWVGALAAVPVLFDAYQLQLEQNIMADTLFEAVIVAGLTALLWRPRPRLRAILLAGLAFGVAAIIREVGLVLIVPAAVYLCLAARGRRPTRSGPWRHPVAYPALLCLSFGLPVLGYLSVNFALTGRTEFAGEGSNLYGRAAAAADCTTLRTPSYEAELCPTPSTVRKLGVDGLIHSRVSPAIRFRPPAGMSAGNLRADFTRQVFLQQPLAVARAVGDDIRGSFSYPRTNRQADTPISRWQFQTSYPVFLPELSLAREAHIMQQSGGGTPGVVKPTAVALRAYQLSGGYTPGPLLALAGVTGLAGAAGADRLWGRVLGRPWETLAERRRSRRRERLWGRRAPAVRAAHTNRADGTDGSATGQPAGLRAACFLITSAAILLLLGADFVEFSWRYQLPGLVILPLAGALGITALASRPRRRAGRSRPQAELRDRPRADAARQVTTGTGSQRSTAVNPVSSDLRAQGPGRLSLS